MSDADYATAITHLVERWDRETDVLVVGFGGAGAAAGIEAADAGAQVLIVEKTRKAGGATYMSGGVIYAAGTSVQRAAGITDSADAMFNYWMAADGAYREEPLVRTLADKSAELIDWLITMGAEFPPEELYSSGAEAEYADVAPPRPRAHHVRLSSETPIADGPQLYANLGNFQPGKGGSHLFTVLERAVRRRPIEVRLETEAHELIMDGEKQVVGARISVQGKSEYVRARRGVVLACGGFTRSIEMHRRFSPKATWIEAGKISMRGHPGESGDGIKMAMALGADLSDMPWYHAHPSTYIPVAQRVVVSPGERYPSIFVNKMGERFVNEDRYYVFISAALDRQDSLAFQIFDNDSYTKANIPELKQRLLANAPTVRELAAKLGISAEGLERTICIWNQAAASGADPVFGKSGPTVGAIVATPLWGGELRREFNQTYGGIRTNADAQVLDVMRGKPIRRLYAAGETTGGRMGSFYPGSGGMILDCLVFGRIAGRRVAAEQPLGSVRELVGAD